MTDGSNRHEATSALPSIASIRVEDAIRLLGAVEEIGRGATGALIVGPREAPLGMIFVELGRVCWATSSATRHRLTDLLRHATHPPLPLSELERVYQTCKAEGRPLGEELVSSGLLTADTLRLALVQHTLEAFATIQDDDGRCPPFAFVEHRRRGYDPRFTFSPAELMVGLGRLRFGAVVEQAACELSRYRDDITAGVAFLRDGSSHFPLPVCAIELESLRVGDLYELGAATASCFDLSVSIDPACNAYILSTSDGCSVVGWQDERIAYALLVRGAASLGCVLVLRRRDFARTSA